LRQSADIGLFAKVQKSDSSPKCRSRTLRQSAEVRSLPFFQTLCHSTYSSLRQSADVKLFAKVQISDSSPQRRSLTLCHTAVDGSFTTVQKSDSSPQCRS
ncbi:unnamed protein product, partial [Meganyctiphanes norvegica]